MSQQKIGLMQIRQKKVTKDEKLTVEDKKKQG